MKYTIIAKELHIAEREVVAYDNDELRDLVDAFCEETGADPFTVDTISERDTACEEASYEMIENDH